MIEKFGEYAWAFIAVFAVLGILMLVFGVKVRTKYRPWAKKAWGLEVRQAEAFTHQIDALTIDLKRSFREQESPIVIRKQLEFLREALEDTDKWLDKAESNFRSVNTKESLQRLHDASGRVERAAQAA